MTTRNRGRIAVLGLAFVGIGGATARAGLDNKSGSPIKVADALDRFVQGRFDKVDGRIGLSRMVSIVGHSRVRLLPETEDEKRLMAEAKSAGRPYVVSFMHCAVPPSRLAVTKVNYPQYAQATRSAPKPYLLQIGFDLGTSAARPARGYASPADIRRKSAAETKRWIAISADLDAIAKKGMEAVPRTMKGERVDFVHGEWTVSLRPVVARNGGCISCHKHSKVGDTLGVMVYSVSDRKSSLERQSALAR